jgi:hypothetical protein
VFLALASILLDFYAYIDKGYSTKAEMLLLCLIRKLEVLKALLSPTHRDDFLLDQAKIKKTAEPLKMSKKTNAVLHYKPYLIGRREFPKKS